MIFPLAATEGTVATTIELLQLVVDAVTPLKVTEPDVPKLLPEIVTDWPIPTGLGEIEEIVGVCACTRQHAKTARLAFRPYLTNVDRSTSNPPKEIEKLNHSLKTEVHATQSFLLCKVDSHLAPNLSADPTLNTLRR